MEQVSATHAGTSVAPPGWSPAAPTGVGAVGQEARPIDLTARAPDLAGRAPEEALRARINAGFLDNLLLYLGYLALCGALHWQLADPSHWAVYAIAALLYHFGFESRDGQTPGKRRYGVRVVSTDGSRASARAIALRSVLRIIDQLPFFYASGLINMIRTGPRRRQRIGDVVGQTIVIPVDAGTKLMRTPRWLLPTATLVTTLASVLLIIGILNAGSQPLTSSQASEFVAGCNETAGRVLDCQCVLVQLEDDGYTTLDSLRTLFNQERDALATGDRGAVPPALVNAAASCRR